jgi:hypothetical protein
MCLLAYSRLLISFLPVEQERLEKLEAALKAQRGKGSRIEQPCIACGNQQGARKGRQVFVHFSQTIFEPLL